MNSYRLFLVSASLFFPSGTMLLSLQQKVNQKNAIHTSFANDRGLSQILRPFLILINMLPFSLTTTFTRVLLTLPVPPHPKDLQAPKLLFHSTLNPAARMLFLKNSHHIPTQLWKKSSMAKSPSTVFKRTFHNLAPTYLFNLISYHYPWTTPAVFKRGQFCPPGNIWHS